MSTAIILAPIGGGLGNLLFQHHAAYALMKQRCPEGTPLYVLTNLNDDRGRPTMQHYAELFKHVKFITPVEMNELFPGQKAFYEEAHHYYDPIPAFEGPIILRGYFQSFKYFPQPHMESMSALLRSNEQVTWDRATSQFNSIEKPDPVCVHVRRGDYLQHPTQFPVLPESYYEKALASFPGRSFYVYAEDIDEIIAWSCWKNYDVSFIREPSPLTTVFMMAQSRDHIIANSSLSLMGVYLSPHKGRVIGPMEWFGADGPEYKISDFYEGTRV